MLFFWLWSRDEGGDHQVCYCSSYLFNKRMAIHVVVHVQATTLNVVEVSLKVYSHVVIFKDLIISWHYFDLLLNMKVEIVISLYYFVLFYNFFNIIIL